MKGWVLITGASAGIGLELAGLIAADGFNLILVARRQDVLRTLADRLQAQHGIEVKVLAKDLSQRPAASEILAELGSTPISILVNNAGFGWFGPFAEETTAEALDMMQVNMGALVELTRLILPAMQARGAGRILNVASTAAFQPGPFAAVYYATKAFVLSFSCALAEELAGTGITVTALCPGATQTEFFQRAGGAGPIARRVPMMAAGQVARAGYRGLMRGSRVVIPGMLNRITATAAKLLPGRLITKIASKLNKP